MILLLIQFEINLYLVNYFLMFMFDQIVLIKKLYLYTKYILMSL
jgi:hypothetical protein